MRQLERFLFNGGGITALYQCGNADPRAKGERLFFDAPAKDSTQTRAEDAHYAGSNNMSPPDQQGDGRKQVKQR